MRQTIWTFFSHTATGNPGGCDQLGSRHHHPDYPYQGGYVPADAQADGINEEDAEASAEDERAGKVQGSPFYNINPKVDDLPKQYMLEKDGIKLMVLGAIQTAEGGCACPENTVLKRLLTKLLLTPTQTILLDMEAGVEHLGRGTVAGVDILLVVVIPSKSSVRTAKKIQKLAAESGIPRIAFVGNMIEDEDDQEFLSNALCEKPIAFFPNSAEIRKAERSGKAITEEAKESFAAAKQLLNSL